MADNISVKDATGATQTVRMKDVSGVKVSLNILSDQTGSPIINEQTAAGSIPVALPTDQALRGRGMILASDNFTRPADTTTYAANDTVANSTVAGSVTPLTFVAARYNGGSGFITGARISKTTNVTTNAQFRLHIFDAAPTMASGDNAALSCSGINNWIGSIDIAVGQAFTDGAAGRAAGSSPAIMFDKSSGTNLYGILQALAAYGPGNAEVFTVALEIEQS